MTTQEYLERFTDMDKTVRHSYWAGKAKLIKMTTFNGQPNEVGELFYIAPNELNRELFDLIGMDFKTRHMGIKAELLEIIEAPRLVTEYA